MHSTFGGEGTSIRRRAAVVVQVALMLTAIAGFAALTIDVGAMYNAKADLQRTADAAALAAAAKLASYEEGDPMSLAREQAELYTQRNGVFQNDNLALATSDVEFGRAVFNESNGSFGFQPTTTLPDAVRVTVRMTSNSANGALALYFARVLGHTEANITASAVAMMIPRDIAIVADLSASHNDDSELKNYANADINLHEVWDSFPGGIDDDTGTTWNGTEFPTDGEGHSPQMAGPAWGFMKNLGYGTQTLNSSYNPANDPGLIKLQYNQNWSSSELTTALVSQGYSATEVNAIMSRTYDRNGAWDERAAVALGLARWNSGIPGGRWESEGVPPDQVGNGNVFVGSGELTWQETFGDRSVNESRGIFRDYINNYMKRSDTQMARANSAFRYRFGVKTFMNYLMEKRYTHGSTPELANAPHQPMQAVKNAVDQMVDILDVQETNDRVSLEAYDLVGRHLLDLTSDFQSVAATLREHQAGNYAPWTNVGDGIQHAIAELTSHRARPTSRKTIFLLTDGVANVNQWGDTGDYVGGPEYARAAAQTAADLGIRIFSVSVGSGADQALMNEMAELGSGVHFHAEGSIEAYTVQLENIFRSLGGTRPVELIN